MPAVENPATFDLHCPNPLANISFGKGIHHCLGAKVARFEARVVTEVTVKRLPTATLASTQQLNQTVNISFRGPTSLAVE